MSIDFEVNTHEQRELNKMALDTFYFNKHNFFNDAINKLILDKEDEIKKDEAELEALAKTLHESTTEKNRETCNRQHLIAMESIYYNEQELKTLVEMQIIYAYKMFEIDIKQLITASFNLKNDKDLYKWDNILFLLKDKGITTKEIEGYEHLNQLRLVNNSLKHSGKLSSEIKKNPEFSNNSVFTYYNLKQFHNRVKGSPMKFSQALSSEIYKVLYNFDSDRIHKIAKSIALRMEESEAQSLSEALTQLYKPSK